MRVVPLLSLGLVACQSESLRWAPPPDADAVLFVVQETERGGLALLGRLGPGDTKLTLSDGADQGRLFGLSFERETLERLSPRLNLADGSTMRLELEAEPCRRRTLRDTEERRPVPGDTPTFELDAELEWHPLPGPPEWIDGLSMVLPVDASQCGSNPPVLRPFGAEPMALLDGFEAYGRPHDAKSSADASKVFSFRSALATPHPAVLAASLQYLYFLPEGRSVESAGPGEILSPIDVRDLPQPSGWSFGQLVRVPGHGDRYLVALGLLDGSRVGGAVALVETSSAGFRSAVVVGVTPNPLEALAILESGAYIAVGSRGILAVADAPEAPLRVTSLFAGVALKLAATSGRADYPFVVADSTGGLALVEPHREAILELTEGGFSSSTVDLTSSAGPPSRVHALRYNAQLLTATGSEAPAVSVVPMPASLARCASDGDTCEPHILGQDPGAIEALSGERLIMAPRLCVQLTEWQPAKDCFFGWRGEPEAPAEFGFKGFETLDYHYGRLIAAGWGGVVYQAVLDP